MLDSFKKFMALSRLFGTGTPVNSVNRSFSRPLRAFLGLVFGPETINGSDGCHHEVVIKR
jgi:hypothetical protein